MFIALETVALPSQLGNDCPFSVSLSKGCRIKHVLNVGAMHLDRDKLMCSRRCSPKQGAGERRVLMSLPKAITAHDRQRKFHIASEQDKKCAEGHLGLN